MESQSEILPFFQMRDPVSAGVRGDLYIRVCPHRADDGLGDLNIRLLRGIGILATIIVYEILAAFQ
jgi:hypothetical protein